jgi:hypothetical protein
VSSASAAAGDGGGDGINGGCSVAAASRGLASSIFTYILLPAASSAALPDAVKVHVKVETRNAFTWVWKQEDCPVAFSPAYKTCEEQPAGCYGAEEVYNKWDLRTICPYDDW